MFEGNLSCWRPGVNVVVSYKMADNEDLLDDLTDAIQALNVAIGEVNRCKAHEMASELQDMRDHLVRRMENAEHGASTKQATRLLAMARQLLAAEGEADPAGEALMLKVDTALEALEAAQKAVKAADGALDALCGLVDESDMDSQSSKEFYRHAGKMTKAIQALPAVVTDFHAGHDGIARALGKAKLVK